MLHISNSLVVHGGECRCFLCFQRTLVFWGVYRKREKNNNNMDYQSRLNAFKEQHERDDVQVCFLPIWQIVLSYSSYRSFTAWSFAKAQTTTSARLCAATS